MDAAQRTIEQSQPTLTFLYHELRPQRTRYTYAIERSEFAQQLDLFAEARQLPGPRLRPEISFDDGHSSNYEHALPLLLERGLVAHFFITVGWTAQRPGYMGWAELRALQNDGQRIGAHGWTHTLLTRCSDAELQKELGDARHALEDKLGIAVTTMSLPGGRYNRRVLAACRAAGYSQVFTSIPRAEAAPGGWLAGRVNMRSGASLRAICALLQPRSAALAKLRREYRIKQAAQTILGDSLYMNLWSRLNRREQDEQHGLITAP